MTTTVPAPTPSPTASPALRTPPTATPALPTHHRRLPLVVRLEAGWVRVRQVHHGDGPALQALIRRMSARTRWLRFHSPIAQLTAAQLRSLLDADHRDQETLLAEVEREGRWHLAGFAQYHRLRGGGQADSAIALEDGWQRRGIGTVLARCLAERASVAGIAALTGEVLSENRTAIGFIRGLAPRLEGRPHGTTVELVCWLSGWPAQSPAPAR